MDREDWEAYQKDREIYNKVIKILKSSWGNVNTPEPLYLLRITQKKLSYKNEFLSRKNQPN
jgi:hypothetical protein